MNTESEAELIHGYLRSRTESAFRALYRHYSPYLFALALRLCAGRREEAEEVLQETWIRAARQLERFEGRSRLRTWLSGILVNCCRERRRRTREPLPAAPWPAATGSASPAMRVDLERLVRALPDGQREVLVLFHLEGFTHPEIAAALGIAPGTSKSRLFEARRSLRRWLEDGTTPSGDPT